MQRKPHRASQTCTCELWPVVANRNLPAESLVRLQMLGCAHATARIGSTSVEKCSTACRYARPPSEPAADPGSRRSIAAVPSKHPTCTSHSHQCCYVHLYPPLVSTMCRTRGVHAVRCVRPFTRASLHQLCHNSRHSFLAVSVLRRASRGDVVQAHARRGANSR